MCAAHRSPRSVPRAVGSSRAGGVWAVTVWTTKRAPTLVTAGPRGVALSQAGQELRARWVALGRAWPGVVTDEVAILPDRLRGVLHVPAGLDIGAALARLAGGEPGSAAAERRLPGAEAPRAPMLDVEAHPVSGPEELALCRRRIRAAAGALYGRSEPGSPAAVAPGARASRNGTSTTMPSRATLTSANTSRASAKSSGASRE